jgi:hypothetical protein
LISCTAEKTTTIVIIIAQEVSKREHQASTRLRQEGTKGSEKRTPPRAHFKLEISMAHDSPFAGTDKDPGSTSSS